MISAPVVARAQIVKPRQIAACLGVCLSASFAGALAQSCATGWLPGDGTPDVFGGSGTTPVTAMQTWDPDGPGPAPSVLVVAGDFRFAGTQPALNIAAFHPETKSWSALGDGIEGRVKAFAATNAGVLYAAVEPLGQGGQNQHYITRWDGQRWQTLSAFRFYYPAIIRDLAILPNGHLVAVGRFNSIGTVPAMNIAEFDGTFWRAVGVGLGTGAEEVQAVHALPNGDVIAGGRFGASGGTAMNNIARWDGSSWHPLGAGVSSSSSVKVSAIVSLADGDLLVGGTFTMAGDQSVPGFARWNGSDWAAIPDSNPRVTLSVEDIAVMPNHDIYVLENILNRAFVNADDLFPFRRLRRWDGASWDVPDFDVLGASARDPLVLAVSPQGTPVIAARNLTTFATIEQKNDGVWAPLGTGFDSQIFTVASASNGDVIVGGTFRAAGGAHRPSLARRASGVWSSLDPDNAHFDGIVRDILVQPNQDIIVAGDFLHIGPNPARNIVRWNGFAWDDLQGGVSNASVFATNVFRLINLPSGNFVAAGFFQYAGSELVNNIAEWDQERGWVPMGEGLPFGTFVSITDLALFPNGDLLVAGSSTEKPVFFMRWDGQHWSELATPGSNPSFGWPMQVTTLDDVRFVVSSSSAIPSAPANKRYLQQWNGSAWAALGSGPQFTVNAMLKLPSGDLLAGGVVIDNQGQYQDAKLARWDGSAWSPVPGQISSGYINDLALLPTGNLAMVGSFASIDGNMSYAFAEYAFAGACPADFNCSHGVNVQDIFDFLNAWFNLAPASDFNRSGSVTVQDIFAFLDAWFLGC